MLLTRFSNSNLFRNELKSSNRLLSTLINNKPQQTQIYSLKPKNHFNNKLNLTSLFHTSSIQNIKTPKYDWVPVKTTKNYLQEIEKDEGESKTAHITRYILWLCLFLIPTIAFRLGIWQYDRLKWKIDLIANCEERLYMPPLDQDTLIDSFTLQKDLEELRFLQNDPEEFEKYVYDFNAVIDKNYQYRRVTLIGEWDYSNEMFIGPRMKNGHKGYKLFTPLILRGGEYDGERLLIERGWISERNSVPYLRTLQHLSCPKGIVEITVFMKAAKRLGHGQMERGESNARVWQLIEWPEMLKQGDCKIPLYCQQITDLYDHNWKIEDIKGKTLNFEKLDDQKNNKSWFSWFKNTNKNDQNSKQNDGSSIAEDSITKAPYSSPTAHKKLILVDKADKSLEFDELQFIKAGVPIGETPDVKYTNDHFQYMVTWFLLAASSGTALVIFILKSRRNGLMKVTDMKKTRQKRSEKIFGK